jgi:hypothetical protein
MPTISRWSYSLHVAAAAALMILAAGACAAQPAPPPGGAPVPPGQARVWFYRVFFPEDTGGMPPVSMNGNTIGYARAGWSFYRDVPAGNYQVSVQSVGNTGDQTRDIVLAPGSQAYLAIASDPTWMSDRPGSRQPTYSVDVEPARIAAIHMAQSRLGSGD